LVLAVLTRNERCPPHAHVGSTDWEARFEFSFWHNGVRLWDVVPLKNKPSVAVLEGLRQALKEPEKFAASQNMLVAKCASHVFGQSNVGRQDARGRFPR